jgi:hypothetical protein
MTVTKKKPKTRTLQPITRGAQTFRALFCLIECELALSELPFKCRFGKNGQDEASIRLFEQEVANINADDQTCVVRLLDVNREGGHLLFTFFRDGSAKYSVGHTSKKFDGWNDALCHLFARLIVSLNTIANDARSAATQLSNRRWRFTLYREQEKRIKQCQS